MAMAIAVSGFVTLTKGKPLQFLSYVAGTDSYTGNSLIKKRIVASNTTLMDRITHDPNFEDFRRPHPDFFAPPKERLRSTIKAGEQQRYLGLIENVRNVAEEDPKHRRLQTVERIVELIHDVYRGNLSGPDIENGVLGRDKSFAEDYVFQLANRRTACGTVGEATVALMREAGFRARLVIHSTQIDPLVANHILAEAYVPELGRWVMLDPMVRYTGKQSAFTLLGTEEAKKVSALHGGGNYYNDDSVLWMDKRGLLRKIYYYTPEEKNIVRLEQEIDLIK